MSLSFTGVIAIEFGVTGTTGREKVDFFDANTGYRIYTTGLKKNMWYVFDFVERPRIRMHLIEGDIIFHDPQRYHIKYLDAPNDWRCDSATENTKCGLIKNGQLKWKGNYIITMRGISYYFTCLIGL